MVKHELDAHQRPPDALKVFYKRFLKYKLDALYDDPDIADFSRIARDDNFNLIRTVSFPLSQFQTSSLAEGAVFSAQPSHPVDVYEHSEFPGLELLPAMLPKYVQANVLNQLLHRDLASELHKTNVHTHYHIPYELSKPNCPVEEGLLDEQQSFFNCDPKSTAEFTPRSPKIHKPITVAQFLGRKLRWLTLGGQYDWTRKVYPEELPPAFPKDIGDLIHGIFPHMKPEAAIVNIYSPGDTLALHRDVSEESDRGLVSISLGCEGLFVVGISSELDAKPHCLAIRLRSGDGIYMSGPTRYAWHGVPKIIANTCPDWLKTWPTSLNPPEPEGDSGVSPKRFEAWAGWMADKRINLNVRQMNI